MTMFIKLENNSPVGYPILEENFRQSFPEINLPKLVTAADIEPHGYGLYDFSNQPILEKYQKAVETTPVKNEFGIWKQTWQVVEKNNEEKAIEDQHKAEYVRGNRNWLLTNSDWTQLADTPLTDSQKTAWATYRQELRDVPAQSGFPWNVTWPVKP